MFSFLFSITGFRKKRMIRFFDVMNPDSDTKILDLGGTCNNWDFIQTDSQITLLNLDSTHDRRYKDNIKFIQGDALDITFTDNSFDIVFSNSVIEHVHTWENQKRFASEALRIGKKVWIQTPAREFFLEPHYITPFIHWFPKQLSMKLIRNFTLYGLIKRPTLEDVKKMVDEIRLISHDEMKELFPGCTIEVEKWMGFPKSYIAVKNN